MIKTINGYAVQTTTSIFGQVNTWLIIEAITQQ